MKRTTCVLAVALALAVPMPALAVSPCPDIRVGDEKRSAKLSTSLSLVTKLLSSLGLAGEYTSELTSRLPTQPDQILALFQYKVACEIIIADTTLSTPERLKYLREEFASIFLITKISPQSGLPGQGRYRIARIAALQRLDATVPALSPAPLWRVAAAPAAQTLPPPPAHPPPKGATIIRVFPKKNLDVVGVIRLRRLLPDFDVRIGSSQINQSNLADTLFVDRDKVSPETVIEILRTLEAMDVRIKSVQQSSFRQPEIQVGTIVRPDGKQVFAATSPLDIARLANEAGIGFWRAAFNGYVSCSAGIGHAYPCSMTSDARPQPRGKS